MTYIPESLWQAENGNPAEVQTNPVQAHWPILLAEREDPES